MKVTRGNRLHIGFYGKRNVGKSTLFNLILGQDYSITSDVSGTTTDVNAKPMELLPIGPVTLMDCAGIDDVATLGKKRIEKTLKTLNRVDIAIYICDYDGLNSDDEEFLKKLRAKNIPLLFVVNKTDSGTISQKKLGEIEKYSHNILQTSCTTVVRDIFLEKFKAEIIKILPKDSRNDINLLPNGFKKGNVAILVIPIDKEAPAGRLILPQVQTLRAMLDSAAISIVCQVDELKKTLNLLGNERPKLVVTDSQAFKEVNEIVPDDIMLTSYSIMFARLKGDLDAFVEGSKALDKLENGDKILICESCTHHAIEDDIGRVKIPHLVRNYKNIELIFEHYSGFDLPKNLNDYKLIIHCGACMTSRTEILRRIELARSVGVAITNYGVIIAKCLGILDRALEVFAPERLCRTSPS